MPLTEGEFLESIDCRFPYGDAAAAHALIEQARVIGPNASFAIADELARPGHEDPSPAAERLALLDVLQSSTDHPLAPMVLNLAGEVIRQGEVPVEHALAVVNAIAAYPGQYAALSLAYLSCDDVDGVLDARVNAVRSGWETA